MRRRAARESPPNGARARCTHDWSSRQRHNLIRSALVPFARYHTVRLCACLLPARLTRALSCADSAPCGIPSIRGENRMSIDPMHAIFADFAKLLETRFTVGVLTTEDSVRYTLFASVLHNNISPDAVIPEFPHPAIPRAQIDTWMPDFHGIAVAIEFKFDREPPRGKNQPKTQKAGSAFEDLRRLLLVSRSTDAVCYFVYVTTEEMNVYFKNSTNGHEELYELLPGNSIDIRKIYFSDKPKTFMEKLQEEFEANITSVLKKSLSGGHFLRIYKISPIDISVGH